MFIHRYFDTAKATVINIKRQLFARTLAGYVVEANLIVKVYPQLNDQIVFIGFLQKANTFNDMDPVKSEYENLEQQYIIADKEGNITNVTEGLSFDLGLNAKFFNYSESIFQQMFNIDRICTTINDDEIQEELEAEGVILIIDTKHILENLELELLTSEEILEVRSNLCKRRCLV